MFYKMIVILHSGEILVDYAEILGEASSSEIEDGKAELLRIFSDSFKQQAAGGIRFGDSVVNFRAVDGLQIQVVEHKPSKKITYRSF